MPLPPTSWRKLSSCSCGQAAEHERARVDAGGGMALEEDEVAAVLVGRRVPEMIEADVVERRRRREARDVAADVGVLVRAHAPSPSRSSARTSGCGARCSGSPGNARLRVGGIVLMYAVFAENGRYAPRLARLSIRCSIRKCARSGPSTREHGVERVEPFARFLRIDVGLMSMGVLSNCGPMRDGSDGRAAFDYF